MNEELKIIISAQIDKLKQNVDKAKQEISGFKEQVQKASKEVDSKFKEMGASIATGAKAMATGLAAAGAAVLALGASTAEYRAEQAKLVTAFEAAGSSAETAKTTYNDLFRVLGDSGQATEAANHLAKLTTEEQALAEWTNICQGVYATFGDSIPIEGLTEAANETAKTGALTGSLADALNWAGISEDAFSESLAACNTEAEREALIRETLSGLYSDAAAKYEENNAAVLEQNEAQARLQETLAKVGEAVAPIITLFTSLAADALAAVVPYIQQLAEQYMPVLKELLEGVGTALSNTIQWISEHTTLLTVVASILAVIIASITAYNAVAAIKAAMAALEVTTVAGLVTAYLAQAAAMLVAIAPYALIVAAIAGFIAIVVKAYKENETFRKIVDKVFNDIKKIIKGVMDAVKAVIETVWAAIKLIWDGGLKQILNAVLTVLGAIVQYFTNKLSAVLSFVTTVFTNIVNSIKSKLELARTVVTNVLALIKAIFTGDLGAAKQAVVNILNGILQHFKNIFNNAKNVVKSAIDSIKSFFNFSWSLPKLKMPHLKISGSFSLSPPSVPKFSIDWYAKGGVFDNPTLFPYGGNIGGLGEAGAEAIVPLENNLEWLDKLAAMLNDRMGGKQPVVLTVDGRVFAETAINTINANTRQSGKLALNIV